MNRSDMAERADERVPDGGLGDLPAHGLGFFLSTLGYHSHAVWADRLVPLGVDSRQANMLLQVAAAESQSQLAVARVLHIPPSRVVALVDDLERRRLLRRRANPSDRRVRTLHLTPLGRDMVRRLAEVVAAHEAGLSVGLGARERDQLMLLLTKVAAGLGLSSTGHSGLAGRNWKRP
jgi:DNA-binding MarR family transcriptional regulator